jgi:hypothetical protein
MTFRLFGLPDEFRLQIEEASNGTITTEAARLIIEKSVQQAQGVFDASLANITKEVQGVIGPHGSVTRLQAGGINITRGEGISVYADGVSKTTITPRGDVVIGSDITQPATTTEIFFVEANAYNGESFGAGDFLIGDNSTGQSNVKWDASEGQLQFRYGTTLKAYMDTDGSIKAGGGDVILDEFGVTFANQEGLIQFLDTNGAATMTLYSDGDNWLVLENSFGGKGISFLLDNASHVVKQIDFDGDGNIELYDGGINIPAGKAYSINGARFPLFLSFGGAYAAISANSTVYAATIDRTVSFAKWTQSYYVATTNDANNYWRIVLTRGDGTTIEEITTSAGSPDTWTQLSSTSFDVASVGTADKLVYISVVKAGSGAAPGNLFLAGPAVEVYL